MIGLAALVVASPSSSYSYFIKIPRLGLTAPLNYKSQDISPYIYYQDDDTIAVAAHRVTPMAPFYSYGPFRHIDRLETGDPIFINKRKFIVMRHKDVRPYETWILNYKGLVISACDPPHSAAFRYVVFAKEVTRRTG